MRKLFALLYLIVAVPALASEPVKPEIREGTWHIPFRYWSHLSPVLEGTGGFDFLCEVERLGDDVPAAAQGPLRHKTGVLKVLEVLNADTKTFPEIKQVKTLAVSGCEGFKVGDRLVVFVDGEPYEGGYVIDYHRGTNSLLGHRLARNDEDDLDKGSERLLVDLVRKGRLDVQEATADELRLLALMDPSGVAEALIRELEMGRLVRQETGESGKPVYPTIHGKGGTTTDR